MALAGEPDINSLHYIYQNEIKELDLMSRFYLSASLALLGEREEAMGLILHKSILDNKSKSSSKHNYFYSNIAYKALKFDILNKYFL